MRAWREGTDTETEATRAETKANQAKTEVMWDKKMEANMNVWRKETMICQETTEARLECKEPTLEDMKAVHREVPMEDAAAETGKAPS
jgi:hypothetical protein